MKTKHVKQVTDFHKAYGMPVGSVKVKLDVNDMTQEDGARVMLRHKLLVEEFEEVMKATNPEELIKEACDLVYVILGMFVEFGWDFDKAFNRVHESNMSKLDENGKPIYRDDGKVLKGPNYKTADMSDLV
jgi:predicted HAD superfamily Cof-like phosphohydrolase